MSLQKLCAVVIIFFLFTGCKNNDATKQAVGEKLTPEEKLIHQRIDSLKQMAREGDLITRMNDNIVSSYVKSLNIQDKSFSHAGIVVIRNGKKMVCSVDADAPGIDTVRFDPIDSFINPKENFECGLFRFELSEQERKDFIKQLNSFHDAGVHFDRLYDLNTDSAMYCSEMISKSLTRTTNGRLKFPQHDLPKQIIPVMIRFFMMDLKRPKEEITKIVLSRKFTGIDDLYLSGSCTELMRFKLKYFAGQ